ncbi:LacI family DNA-binding transcriptional regulator [Nonomuraea sp. LPB2021202275-12-8]|uniref:LacI family DNA-binding transcriptional regulator n=1 Tax=Nonomuraea sp. LPB2021202275-12-8 TaxID=3120159 RepID=UPI00300C5F12
MPRAARRTVTLHDVAAAAGVSVATASRVLGGSSRTVAPEFEERVLAAAAALRYTADASARAMRRAGESITLIADDLTTPAMGIIVAAMERQARMSGVFVTVSSTWAAPERQLEAVRVLRALRPRALVLTSSRFGAGELDHRLLDELRAYERDGGRVVIAGVAHGSFDSIAFDNHAAGRLVGAHVARTGHGRVTILAGPAERVNFAGRVSGFVEGLRGGGVQARRIRVVHCEASRQGGFDAARELPAGRTDAVLAVNDVIAIGALSAFRAAGVAVPADVSVTGVDDIQLAADVTPRLTTVALPLAHVGAESIRLALRERGTAEHLTVQGRLVIRDSTRA